MRTKETVPYLQVKKLFSKQQEACGTVATLSGGKGFGVVRGGDELNARMESGPAASLFSFVALQMAS